MATMTGWEAVGNVLGGGIDREGAFNEGRLRTAQTENALMMARNRQLESVALEAKNKARADLEDSLIRSGNYTAEQAQLIANVAKGEVGTDFAAGMQGMLRGQEMGFRNKISDPTAPLGDQIFAEQGIQGKVRNPLDMMGSQSYVDLRALPAPGEKATLHSTPLGESMIGAGEATTRLRNVQAGDPDYNTVSGTAGNGPAGVKVPAGMMANPNYNPALPVGEGNYPLIDAKPPTTGSIEHRMNQRMVRSVAQMVPDLTNLLTMPATASLGILGTGTVPGASMLQASVDALRNTVSDDVVRAYEAQSAQIGRAMAFIESNGQPPNEALLADSIRAYSIRPGHTGLDVLRMFANLRQNIEQFNLVQQNDARVPADVRQLLAELTAITQRSVPFTVEQVNALQFANDKRLTMEGLMRQSGFNPQRPGATPAPAAPAAPGAMPAPAAPAPAPTPAPPAVERWERGPDGKLRRVTSPGAP